MTMDNLYFLIYVGDPSGNIDAIFLFYAHYSYPALQIPAIKDRSEHENHFFKHFKLMDSLNMVDHFPKHGWSLSNCVRMFHPEKTELSQWTYRTQVEH